MATQINPALARIWLPNGSRQYGYRKPLILNPSDEGEQRALDYLEHGISNSQLGSLARLARIGDEPLQNLLVRVGSVLTKSQGLRSQLSESEVAEHFAELSRIFLETQDDPAAVLARRRSSRIFIQSMGRTGLTITKGLDNSFIGTAMSLDNSTVQRSDLGALGYAEQALGESKVSAAKQLISAIKIEQHARLSGSMDHVDLAILIGTDVVSPQSYAHWLRREIPHLALVFDETGVQVSPVVVPGITPCLACAEISRMKLDPNWIAVAPQLQQLERSLEDAAMLLFASSIAVNQALNLIDRGIEHVDQLSYRLERSGEISTFEVESSDCGCRSVR